MKKLFVDVGGFTGDTVELAKSDEDIIVFEPNGSLPAQPTDRLIWVTAAAWIYDGKAPLYKGLKGGIEYSLLPYKVNVHDDEFILVDCIDFSKWIKEQAQTGYYKEIRVKMNCEGAEYPVLSKMVRDKTYTLVNEWTVAFHWHKLAGWTEERHEKFLSLLPTKPKTWN